MLPKVVNVGKKELQKRGYKDVQDWLSNPKHLYIGRKCHYVGINKDSKWMNPFSTKKHILKDSLQLYEDHVRQNLINDIDELSHYDELGCWCITQKNPDGCHGIVLLKLLEEQLKQK